jgi:hypothetical protein
VTLSRLSTASVVTALVMTSAVVALSLSNSKYRSPSAPATARQTIAAPNHPTATAPTATVPVSIAPGAAKCAVALAYLKAHSAPEFHFECPGYALGHQSMTCINVPGVCPGSRLITLDTVCPASYENEASNSWVLIGQSKAPIDPFGHC